MLKSNIYFNMFGFINDIINSSGLSMDILSSGFRLINISNKCVYFEGDLKLEGINRDEITIIIKRGKIKICGKNLKIKNMSTNTLLITGDIESMEEGK